MAKPSLLIDSSIYIFQYYFSLPDNWYSENESWPTAAVYGYTTFLVRLLLEQQPQRVAACFDESLETCFRNEIYADYKCSRALPDEGLAFQLNACRTVTDLMGIQTYGSDRYEADDLLGSLYRKLVRTKAPIAILTRDKDLGQLIAREHDYLWDYAAEKKHFQEDIYKKFGVRADQMIDYLALVGDTSDDIPGVPGIGPKTAQALLGNYGSLSILFENIESLSSLPLRGAKTLSPKLREHREQIEIAQQLAKIIVTIPLIERVSELKWKEPQWKKLEKFCHSMGFPRLFSRIRTLKSD
ncbi:MAG: 5'-3' exonuclease [Cellvibrionaceae bacterium]